MWTNWFETMQTLRVAHSLWCGAVVILIFWWTQNSCQIANNLLLEFPFTVPSQPRNVTVHEVTANSIRISWHAPEKPNGPNLIYRIYYTFLNQTLLAMPKNDPDNGMRSESGIHYYTLRKLSKYATLTQTHT